jgi:class 3 adenylate cyclase
MRERCRACGAELPAGARFCPSCATPVSGDPSRVPLGMVSQARDELRPITALFADIVGSTSLGERLTPDEIKALIGECVTQMSRAVEEFGGVIQAYAGDGICAYYGVPSAHEDDPERAARSALRILDVVKTYGDDIRGAWGVGDFAVRVGINSGRAGVGQVGAADPQTVALGDATNVAARLQSAAPPGSVLVGDVTAELLGARFVLDPIGPIQVKGRDQPVSAWRLVAPRPSLEAESVLPLVGREPEVARLRSVVEDLAAGRGQVLLVTGESGIGKTRILGELRKIAGDRVLWLEARCASYGHELFSRPFVDMLRSWLGLGEGEAEIAVRMRLRAKLASLGPGWLEVLPALGRLLSVKLEPDAEARVAALTPDQLWEAVRNAYVRWLEALASRGSLVLALDDLQWADRSTRELGEAILLLTDRAPILVAAALRPDPDSEGWRFRVRVLSDYAHRAVEVPLGALSQAAGLELADAIVPPGTIDDATKKGLVMRAEGNPLFLEELLRSVIAAGEAPRTPGWTVTISTRQLLPPSLDSLFVSRIDGLPPGPRRLIQIAAVMGRTFPVRVLEHLAASDHFQEDFAALFRADLIREVRRYPELECTFKHGLVQEAAISRLTATNLRELYGQVGNVFEELFQSSLDDYLQLLAYYFYRSDDQAKALSYLERAAARAASLNATTQAEELLGRAAKVAARIGDKRSAERVEARRAALPGAATSAPVESA